MGRKYKFVSVTDEVRIDPDAKIILSLGRQDQDNNVSFKVEYDTGLKADRLQVPMTQEEIREYSFARVPPKHALKIGRTEQCITLPSLSSTELLNHTKEAIVVRFHRDDFDIKAHLAARDTGAFSSEEAYLLYIDLLMEIPDMRVWDESISGWNNNNPDSPKSYLQFIITHSLAAEIQKQTGQQFASYSDTHCLLLEREARI